MALSVPVNVWKGIHKNWLFCTILVSTAVIQVIMVELGTVALHVSDKSIGAELWGYCLAFGAGSLIIQQIINLIYRLTVKSKTWWNHSAQMMRRVMGCTPKGIDEVPAL